MSADLLRRAAYQMRANAGWETPGAGYGPHYSTWTPAVALAVAELLEVAADQLPWTDWATDRAVEVARTYLEKEGAA